MPIGSQIHAALRLAEPLSLRAHMSRFQYPSNPPLHRPWSMVHGPAGTCGTEALPLAHHDMGGPRDGSPRLDLTRHTGILSSVNVLQLVRGGCGMLPGRSFQAEGRLSLSASTSSPQDGEWCCPRLAVRERFYEEVDG